MDHSFQRRKKKHQMVYFGDLIAAQESGNRAAVRQGYDVSGRLRTSMAEGGVNARLQ